MKKYLFFYLMFMISCFSVVAQRTVSGIITDKESGESIPGANVILKGTSTGTVTDFDGNFSISVPNDEAILVISFIGYQTSEITVGSRSVLDVSLGLDVTELSEIVVVGYGTQQKKEITSAVASLDEEDFNQGNINDASQLLQGKVPGLSIYNKGGDPNTNSTIRLRGISTVGANAQPLVVIDGVIGASLDNVDPSDIASINVLKDGSAAAIYGSRGSSGVILVTTKSGERGGGVKATYNGFVSAASILNEQPIMSASEYIAAGGNDLGATTDWIDEVTRTAISNVHNVAIAGGTANTTYRFSTNFRDINGILEESGFDQINARANVNHFALNDKLQLNFNMSLTNRESNFSFNEALRYAVLYNPTAPVRFDNGEYFQAILFDNFNPVAIIDQNINVGKRRDINFNIKADYSITDELTFTVNYGQQYGNDINGEFYPAASFFRGLNRNGLARRFVNDDRFTLLESYGSYTQKFGKLGVTFSAGYSFQENEFENFLVGLGNFPSDLVGFNILEASGDRVVGNSLVNVQSTISPEERIIAYFGRANFTFDDAIFFNASLRREGSTRLGADNQWGVFPALGVGVDLNKYLNIGGLDIFKFRGGYGVTGSLPNQFGLAQDLYTYSFTGGGTVSYTREANPDLRWEEKAEINLGLDIGLLNNRLTANLDVYSRDVNDFILTVPAPPGSVATNITANVGSLSTKGIELALNYDAVQSSDFTWNTGVVLSSYKSKLDEFTESFISQMRGNLGSPGQNATNVVKVEVGKEIGQIWGPVFSGEVDENGAPVLVDVNGDGSLVVDQADALADNADFQVLGNGIPDLEVGWTNQLTYKRWDLNAFFRGAFGHSLVNTYRAFYEPIDPGAINSYNRIKSDKAVDGLEVAQFSSLYVEKGDFVKLDNITLGFNADVSKSSAFSSLRLYFSIQNAFVITGYSGIDPEPVLQDFGPVSNGGRAQVNPDVLAPGIDRRNNYFTARTLTFGLNVGF